MSRSNVLSKFAILAFLGFSHSALYSMEAPQELSEEKSLTDILPAEIWSMVADYLPGNNRFLNTELAHQVRLSKETQERIIQSYIAVIDPESDIYSNFQKFIYMPHFSNLPYAIKQKYFELIGAFIKEDFDELNTLMIKDTSNDKAINCFKAPTTLKQNRITSKAGCIALGSVPLLFLVGTIGLRAIHCLSHIIYLLKQKLSNYDSVMFCSMDVQEIPSLEWISIEIPCFEPIADTLIRDTAVCILLAFFISKLCRCLTELKSKEDKIKNIWLN